MVKRNHDILLDGYGKKPYVLKKIELERIHSELKSEMEALNQRDKLREQVQELAKQLQDLEYEKDRQLSNIKELEKTMLGLDQEREEISAREQQLSRKRKLVDSVIHADPNEEESDNDDEEQPDSDNEEPKEIRDLREQHERELRELAEEKATAEEATQLLQECDIFLVVWLRLHFFVLSHVLHSFPHHQRPCQPHEWHE